MKVLVCYLVGRLLYIATEMGRWMIALGHGVVGSNDLEKAKAFYDALLGSVCIATLFEHSSGGRIYGKDGKPFFVVLAAYNKKQATVGNGSMHGFSFDSKEEVDFFHAKALALGGSDEGAPGYRAPSFYMAYCRDLDGNKLCAFKIG